MKSLCVILIVVCLEGLSYAQTSATAGSEETKKANASRSGDRVPRLQDQRYPRYDLRPGDVLDLVFDLTPEFNQSVTIQPDGYVTLRVIGDLHASGMTVPEFTDRVRGAYSKILRRPSIAVVLKEFEKPYFIVGGQVTRPGKYDLRGATTVTQGIAIAGGFNTSAKHSQVVLFRRFSSEWYETKLINVKEITKGRDLNEDVELRSGDMLMVPQNTISKIRQFVPSVGIGIPIL